MERVQDVEVQEREEAVLLVEVTSEKATVTWHKVCFTSHLEDYRSSEKCVHPYYRTLFSVKYSIS